MPTKHCLSLLAVEAPIHARSCFQGGGFGVEANPAPRSVTRGLLGIRIEASATANAACSAHAGSVGLNSADLTGGQRKSVNCAGGSWLMNTGLWHVNSNVTRKGVSPGT